MHSLSTLGQSFGLLFSPRIRRWVFIPQLANLVLYIILAASGWNLLADYLAQWLNDLPEWLSLLDEVLAILGTLLLLVFFQFTFLLTANLIAAPFNSVIVEILMDQEPPHPFGWQQLKQTFSRELSKLGYILPRALLIFALSFIPLIGPVLAAIWSAWILMVNYADYAQEVAGLDFRDLPKTLGKARFSTMTIGFCFSLILLVPFLNLFIPAWASIAGCKHWQKLNNQ